MAIYNGPRDSVFGAARHPAPDSSPAHLLQEFLDALKTLLKEGKIIGWRYLQ